MKTKLIVILIGMMTLLSAQETRPLPQASESEPEKYGWMKGWSYRNMWWITNNKHGAFAARGVHGQTIYIDPAAEMVIVRFASHPVAANAANDAYSLPAYQAVAEYLMINDVR